MYCDGNVGALFLKFLHNCRKKTIPRNSEQSGVSALSYSSVGNTTIHTVGADKTHRILTHSSVSRRFFNRGRELFIVSCTNLYVCKSFTSVRRSMRFHYSLLWRTFLRFHSTWCFQTADGLLAAIRNRHLADKWINKKWWLGAISNIHIPPGCWFHCVFFLLNVFKCV